MVFEAKTVVIGSKNSDILGKHWLFGKIQWYLGTNIAVVAKTQWYLWEIQWYLRQIQCYEGAYTVKFWENTVKFWANALVFGANSVVY